MALITWNDNLSVNVQEIDLQHKKLVGMLNDLHEAMLQGKGSEAMGKIINDMIDYAGVHFQTEEKYFVKFGYLEAGSHKREHADFVNKVNKFNQEFNKDSFTLTFNVLQFLSDWLKNHIMIVDKKYSSFFNEKGLR